MEYMVITHHWISNLTERVNDAIKQGWVPQGGIAYAVGQGNDERFAQAMVREVK
jgi:hypothetical protein